MNWILSHRFDKLALPIADRHYNRQHVGSPQFVPPGRCLVLLTGDADALWVTSWPRAEYVRHAWAGAWVCSCFRNESSLLSSELIKEALSATRWRWPEVPEHGMITFVDPTKVRRKRDFGRCFRRAGFEIANCPKHGERDSGCPACNGETAGGLIALQLKPERFPHPSRPLRRSGQLDLFDDWSDYA